MSVILSAAKDLSSGGKLARTQSWFRSVLACGLSAMLACGGSEPTDELEARPELVYAERNERTGLWSIRGYRDEFESYEIVPGPKKVPRPAIPWMIMRPTTGELIYVAEEPGNGRYILLNPSSGEFSRRALPGFVQSWSPTGDLLTTFTVNGFQVVTLDGTVQARSAVIPLSVSRSNGPRWVMRWS